MHKKGARMYDATPYIMAGLPIPNSKYMNFPTQFQGLNYNDMMNQLKIHDLREFTERFQWMNLPKGITADIIERIMYFRGHGLFYYNDKVEKFQFLPFAVEGLIDEYGRWTHGKSFPFTGVSENKEQTFVKEKIEIVYDDLFTSDDFEDPEEIQRILNEWETGSDKGIILTDAILGLGNIPPIRSNEVMPILNSMATVLTVINTGVIAAADLNIIKVDSQDDLESLESQLKTIPSQILSGNRFLAVAGGLSMDSLRTTNAAALQDLWETFNSFDNYRKSTMGVDNAGVFNKKERMLSQEQMLNGSNADKIYSDGLQQRQRFCDLINQYYGLNMWCVSKNMPTPQGIMMGTEENYSGSEHPDPMDGGEDV